MKTLLVFLVLCLSCKPVLFLKRNTGHGYLRWVVDVKHLSGVALDCGEGICYCREAQLTDLPDYKSPIGVTNREVHVKGILLDKKVILRLPLIESRVDPCFLSLTAPVNIVNAEREIVSRILPGKYRLHRKGNELQATLAISVL